MPERSDAAAYAEKPLTVPHQAPVILPANGRVEDRRRFLIALCVGVLSGGVSIAQEPEKADENMLPMQRLEKLDKMQSGSLTTAEQGAAAVPDMEKYLKVLEDPERKIPHAEAEKAASLLISRLYYGNSVWDREKAAPGEHRKVPYLTIATEAELIRRLGNVECTAEQREALLTKLIQDILWYQCYDKDENVLTVAADKLAEAMLTPKGPVDGDAYLRLLKYIHPLNSITRKAVRTSYPRLGSWIRTHQLEWKKPLPDPPKDPKDPRYAEYRKKRKERADAQMKFMSQIKEISEKIAPFFATEKTTAEEKTEFAAWRQEYVLRPSEEIVKEILKEELEPAHRTVIGEMVARQLMANNGADLNGAMNLISRWGFDTDAHMEFRKYRNDVPSPYGPVRTTTTLFLDAYRATRGDDGPAERYVDPADRKNRQALDQVLTNDSGVYLATLAALSKNTPAPDPAILQTLERNMFATLHSHVARIGGVPSLAEWGEVSARFLNIGANPDFADPNFQSRIKEMQKLLVSGFATWSGRANDKEVRVAGVFGKHKSEVTAALMREKKTEQQREVEEQAAKKVAADRMAFIRAFRAAVPALPEQDNILKMFGFTEEELAQAKKSTRNGITDPTVTMLASCERDERHATDDEAVDWYTLEWSAFVNAEKDENALAGAA